MKLPFKMHIDNDITQMRADTFWTKEPETLAWIESFKDGEAFFDIGANVGIYSLYCASLHPSSQIYAFEPMPKNFIRLMQNVELNGFKNVHCFNVAISGGTGLYSIFIPNNEVGQSGTQIDEPVDEEGNFFNPQKKYLIQHWTLDDFVGQVNSKEDCHIKIDVDGHEESIIDGMRDEIVTENPKSLLIECNGDNRDGIVTYLSNRGYTSINPFNKHPNHSRIRRQKEGIKAENVVFVRA